MIYETVFLKDFFPGIQTDATLTSYVRSNSDEIEPGRRRASVLICPGGGYWFTCCREAEPVALAFVSRGYNAFVLDYSTRNRADVHYPTQLLEASAALAYIRRNAAHYNVKENAVAVCGFSAGGHLAASLATLWNEEFITDSLGISKAENRPDGLILGYPVITSGEYAHRETFTYLLGEDPEEGLLEKLSLENAVGAHMPPAFLWHTLNDDGVPSENTFLFAKAMKAAGVPFEMHIYPEGIHGLSLGSRETRDALTNRENEHVTSWIDLCTAWMAQYVDNI